MCESSYDAPVVSPTRIALVVLGLAAVVYGTASLTGGWLTARGGGTHRVPDRYDTVPT